MPPREFRYVGQRLNRPDGADKVTGRARYGSDFSMPGQLVGKVLRSPHPHARINRIDVSRAAELAGVKAIITGADFPRIPEVIIPVGKSLEINTRHLSDECMAREKVLFHGHAVAAVAATSSKVAEEALNLIEVDYEILPHVINVEDAIRPDAPILHDDLRTQGVDPPPTQPSNIAKVMTLIEGDTVSAMDKADVVVEYEFSSMAVHHGYIEPNAAVASMNADGIADIWCCTQGQFMVRTYCAAVLDMDISKLRVTASEIGGGFGAKTTVNIEPIAVLLSKASGRPVKIVLTRDEVFRAVGGAPAIAARVKIGADQDGTIRAAELDLKQQAGAYPGGPITAAMYCSFASYSIDNVKVTGYDVVSNRPKVQAYRGPGGQSTAWVVESALDALALKLDIDPVQLRLKNVAEAGTRTHYGAVFESIGSREVLETVRDTDHYRSSLPSGHTRGVAFGFWFNAGMDSSASIHLGDDGTVSLASGSVDIGGTRASLSMLAAEELGLPYEDITAVIPDTSSIGYTFNTAGSRVTFATGLAVIEAARELVRELRKRAAQLWEVDFEDVEWMDGIAADRSKQQPEKRELTISQLASLASATGGPISGHGHLYADKVGPSFGCHIADVSVDDETGATTVHRYTVVQDVGRAIHPDYVEGQMQGGAVQGIGWALNEELIYDEAGRLDNASFLDYRMPVASDLPMINTVIVEVPNEHHPYGVRGVGEMPIIPPMGTIANAVSRNVGIRLTTLPISPPNLLREIQAHRQD